MLLRGGRPLIAVVKVGGNQFRRPICSLERLGCEGCAWIASKSVLNQATIIPAFKKRQRHESNQKWVRGGIQASSDNIAAGGRIDLCEALTSDRNLLRIVRFFEPSAEKF